MATGTDTADVTVLVNDAPMHARAGTTVAAMLVGAGEWGFRRSVSDQVRGPLCGMGTCYECRVTIDDVPHRRACLTVVADGMRVVTAAARA